ncbi:MAG TPA: HU family DNA-binding protein [Bryobacteraceae bacterium]|nr:HU family DNA-binding protein [Bryobacteraceae bacterium]
MNREYDSYKGRNPRTGEEVSIPPGKAVRFKPGKELQSLQ